MGDRYVKVDKYLPELQEKFPDFSIEDLRKIIKHGSQRMCSIISMKGDIGFRSKINGEVFKLFIGRVNFQSMAHKVRYALAKLGIKLRYLYKKNPDKQDNYYYFGLTDEEFNERYFSKLNPKLKSWRSRKSVYRAKKFNFGDISLYKIFDECMLNLKYKHFFRVPTYTTMGYKLFKRDFTCSDAEYFMKRTLDGYERIDYENDMNDVNDNINLNEF